MSDERYGLTAALRRAADAYPDSPAIRDGARSLTWAEFQAQVEGLADGLIRAGLEPGDRIALLGLNGADYLAWIYAGLWAGLVLVPLNHRWSEAELAFALNDCQVAALVADDGHADGALRLLEPCPNLRHIISMHVQGPNRAGLSALGSTASMRPARAPDLPPSALAGIFYTGGTTGFPKGVKLSHGNLCCGGSMVADAIGLTRGSNYLHVAPMFHLADLAMSFAVTMHAGSHAFLATFDPDGLADTIFETQTTHVVLVPTMIGRVLDSPSFDPARWRSLDRLIYGAAPMPLSLLAAIKDRLPDVGLIQVYGQTELAPVATVLSADDHRAPCRPEILRSAGRPLAGLELEIVDLNRAQCAPGVIGHIRVRGPNATSGYWGREQETRETLIDGWIMTGDLGRVDDDGYVYVVDRAKDMIISGGENVYSAEVENALASHPAVLECAVIGAPDPDLGERVHAVVVPRDGVKVSGSDLRAHCRAVIAPYKCPRTFDFRCLPLPRTAAGKVLKAELRAETAGPHASALTIEGV